MSLLCEKYKKICEQYAKKFEKLIGYELFENIDNEIYNFGDLYFSFSDIRTAIDNNISKEIVLNWQDYAYNQLLKNKPVINLKNYDKLNRK